MGLELRAPRSGVVHSPDGAGQVPSPVGLNLDGHFFSKTCLCKLIVAQMNTGMLLCGLHVGPRVVYSSRRRRVSLFLWKMH